MISTHEITYKDIEMTVIGEIRPAVDYSYTMTEEPHSPYFKLWDVEIKGVSIGELLSDNDIDAICEQIIESDK